MKKVIKTTSTPALVVDFTIQDNVNNPRLAFLQAKLDQHVPFTDDDIVTLISYTKEAVLNNLFCCSNSAVYNNGVIIKCAALEVKFEKKQPWYKRLWNKITGKK